MTEIERLEARIQELEEKLAAAETDEVTGLATRRRVQRELEKAWSAYERMPLQQLSILMIDIDHFKAVNDDYGHDAGDKVLKAVARTIAKHARLEDVVGRYGGEEFVMAIRTQNKRGAYYAAQRVREAVAAITLPDLPKVTVSIGVYCVGDGPSLEAAIKTADGALYQSKREGRNRVTIAQGPA